MIRYYFSKIGMTIAGETPSDKRYAGNRRRRYGHELLDELYNDLQKSGFQLRHQPMDKDGRIALFVSEKNVPNLVFLFTVQAECGELLEMTGRNAAFRVESAATRKAEIFYAGDPKKPKTGMADFLTRTARSWGRN